MQNNEVRLNLGFATLVAAKNLCYEDKIKELMIYLVDDSDGKDVVLQDIAIVRQKYHLSEDTNVDENDEFVNEDKIEVLVFGDRNSEDYTKQFVIRPLLETELKALKEGDQIIVQYRDGRSHIVKFLGFVEDAESYTYTVIFEEDGKRKSLPGTAYYGKYYQY